MRLSKFVVLLTLLLSFLYVVGESRAAVLKNVESACLLTTRCDKAQGQCNPQNWNPLILVHRSLLEMENSLSSDEVFIQECIEVQGSQICVPMPIVRDGQNWKFRNYKADNANNVNPPNVEWVRDIEMFKDAAIQRCVASYVEEDVGKIACVQTMREYFNGQEWTTLSTLLRDQDYQFHGLYEAGTLTPIVDYPVIGNQGKRFEWGSSTTGTLRRSFRVMAFSDPIEGTSGNDPSDKVGQLGFISNEPVCETTSTYDPFGQVFDRESLQPIEGAKVALYREMPSSTNPNVLAYRKVTKDNTPDINVEPFINPVNSNPLGAFSFLVPPGKYKLLVLATSASVPEILGNVPVSGSVMDATVTELGTSITVRVNDKLHLLYPELYQVGKTGTAPNMFLSLPEIIEQDSPERRDISVLSLPLSAAKTLAYSRRVDASGDNIISGQINKPFGLITAKNNNATVLGSAYADVDGKFTLTIDADVLPSGVPYNLEVSAVSLSPVMPTNTPTPPSHSMLDIWVQSAVTHLFPYVQAQSNTSVAKVNPRLNYIEGYAYNDAGVILKDADVTILDTVLGIPVYFGKTDAEGYYTIPSEDLPRNDYVILYKAKDSNSVVRVDSQKFYTQNKTYIEEKKIDVNKPKYGASAQEYLTTHPEPSVTNTQTAVLSPKAGTSGSPNIPKDTMPEQVPQKDVPNTQQISPALLMYVAILLLLIVGAGLLIMYYMKRKQEPHLYE